jgi:hypothetical protein
LRSYCAIMAVPPKRKRSLQSVLTRSTEGFDIADLKAAKALLDTPM